jgi:hypothetical protein
LFAMENNQFSCRGFAGEGGLRTLGPIEQPARR